MNGFEARKIDVSFYHELDEETGDFCVFGDESGFAYASYSNEPEAKAKAEEMNLEREKNRSK